MPRAKTTKNPTSAAKARYEQESMREPYGRGSDESDPQGKRWSGPANTESSYARNAPGKRKSDPDVNAKPMKKATLQPPRRSKH